jgi:hypothetical protein
VVPEIIMEMNNEANACQSCHNYPQTCASRLNSDGRLFDPIRARISAPFVQDQFRRPTIAVGHKGDLRVKGLKKVIANALSIHVSLRHRRCV